MKAFLLAAGLGTRLRPITESTPKCLVRVGGRPLIDIWLDALAAAGVDEVLINTHHLAEQVREHLACRTWPLTLHITYESTLLGSAGTLFANRDFVRGEGMFLVVNADNLTDFDLSVLIDAHHRGVSSATVAVFRAERPSECGIVEVRDERIVAFEEKPAHPRSNLANAGMYAFHPVVIDLIDAPPADIGHDLLPKLVGRARAVGIGDSFLIDVGTPQALERARARWPERTTQ